MNRQTGYYWVKIKDSDCGSVHGWGIGRWQGGRWFVVNKGELNDVNDSYFSEINEDRIPAPDEIKDSMNDRIVFALREFSKNNISCKIEGNTLRPQAPKLSDMVANIIGITPSDEPGGDNKENRDDLAHYLTVTNTTGSEQKIKAGLVTKTPSGYFQFSGCDKPLRQTNPIDIGIHQIEND